MRPARPLSVIALALVIGLAGCAGGPGGPTRADRSTDADPPRPDRDGPPANPPPDLLAVPDAEPKLEPIRIGGPNKPYAIAGESYRPITEDVPFLQRGPASWYGRKFHGARTSSGERYDMYAMSAAHPTLPIPSYVRVRNPANGREVVVRVNDRGPFHSSRIIDLSYTAALKLDLLRGVAPVEIRRITGDEIRAGLLARGGGRAGGAVPVESAAVLAAPSAPPGPAVAIDPVPVSVSTPSEPATVEPAAGDERPVATRPESTDLPSGWWLQFGAFRAREGALALQRQLADSLDWLAPLLAVFHDGPFFRLQAGPFAERSLALSAGDRARREARQAALVVERP